MEAPAKAESKVEIHRGLKGVYFDRSRVCDIDGRAGSLWYRGYSIHELAESFNKRSAIFMEEGRRSLVDISEAASKVTRKFNAPASR